MIWEEEMRRDSHYTVWRLSYIKGFFCGAETLSVPHLENNPENVALVNRYLAEEFGEVDDTVAKAAIRALSYLREGK